MDATGLGATQRGRTLGLPDEQEARAAVIWLADVREGRLASWHILEYTPVARRELGLSPAAAT